MSEPDVAELLAVLKEQQARIERLESAAQMTAAASSEDSEDTDGNGGGGLLSRMNRRGLMLGAVGAGTGVVAGLAAAATPAAAAGGGGAVKLGKPNTETAKTSITNATANAFLGSSGSTKANAAAVQGTISSTAPGSLSAGVLGANKSTSGEGVGVYGTHAGSGYGVYGDSADGAGVFGLSGDFVGVYGEATDGGYGLVGVTGDGNGYGVYGNVEHGIGTYGGSDSGTGVQGSSDTGTAVEGDSNSGVGVRGVSSNSYGTYGTSSTNYGAVGVTTSGNGVYGQVSAASQAGVIGRQLDSSGNWAVYGFGNIGATGTKSAVVPIENGSEYVTLYCVESPECWFEDFGSAKLAAGSVQVEIDPEFAQTITTDSYHVFLQAEGECKGLSVRQKTATGFDVRELDGGKSDVAFAYRLVALRKGVNAPRLNRTALPDAKIESVGQPAPKATPPSR